MFRRVEGYLTPSPFYIFISKVCLCAWAPLGEIRSRAMGDYVIYQNGRLPRITSDPWDIFDGYMNRAYDEGLVLRSSSISDTTVSTICIRHKDVSYRTLIWDAARGITKINEIMMAMNDSAG